MRRIIFVLFSMTVFVCAGPEAFAGVGSQVGVVSGGPAPPACGSSATLYSNSTFRPIRFDLAVSNTGGCTVTLSWTDARGHSQTFTVARGLSEGSSTITVAAGSVIAWTSATAGSGVAFQWQLQRVNTPSRDDQD
jgi:hypothetical protein